MNVRFTRSLVVAASVAALGASAVLFAQPGGGGGAGGEAPRQPGQPGQPGGRGRAGGGEPANLESAMKMMGGALKALKSSAGDAAKKEEALQAVGQLQRGCLASKGIKPGKLPGADLAKAQDDYRRDQIKLMTMALELETLILDGKTKEAVAAVNTISQFRDDSHEKYEEKKDPAGRDPQPPKKDEEKK